MDGKQIELPSASDVANADDIELQDIMENAVRSTEELTAQFKTASQGQVQFEETLPMCELLGLDKQLRSIRGSLKVEEAKKVSVERKN